MNLIFHRLFESTDHTQEYITFRATNNLDLKDYLIHDNSYDEPGKLSNKHRHSYFFPDVKAKKNNFIRLYTGKGKDQSVKNASKDFNNSIIYEFYWDLKVCVWNENGDGVGIIKIGEQKYRKLRKSDT